MITDLPNQLRDVARALRIQWNPPDNSESICRRAADEIETLRDALRLAVGVSCGISWKDVDVDDPGGYVSKIKKLKKAEAEAAWEKSND